jgi:hypothetical protein
MRSFRAACNNYLAFALRRLRLSLSSRGAQRRSTVFYRAAFARWISPRAVISATTIATRHSFQESGLPAPTKSRARSAHRSRRRSREPSAHADTVLFPPPSFGLCFCRCISALILRSAATKDLSPSANSSDTQQPAAPSRGRGSQPRQKAGARSAHRSRRPSRDPLPFAFRCRPWDRHSPEWRF